MGEENTLNLERNVLLISSEDEATAYVRSHFAGRVILVTGEPNSCDPFPWFTTGCLSSSSRGLTTGGGGGGGWSFPFLRFLKNKLFSSTTTDQKDGVGLSIYRMGDINKITQSLITGLYLLNTQFFDVREFSVSGATTTTTVPGTSISVAQVPLNINGQGILVPREFAAREDMYYNILSEHKLLDLRESDKPTNAYRKGLYITPVTQLDDHRREYHLLRCSTNLAGPSDDVGETDEQILKTVNDLARRYFDMPVHLNHVLAQLYCNGGNNNNNDNDNNNNKNSQKKATIKMHSDKTKDMPPEAVMAFCSFYSGKGLEIAKDEEETPITEYPNPSIFDSYYKNTSVLTKLRFRLKKDVVNSTTLPNQFDVVLYPGSVFMMSLTTNRLYTHEIVPSVLPVEKLPTRLGYVVRCSKTRAIHDTSTGETVFSSSSKQQTSSWKTLVAPTEEEIEKLKALYYEENTTSNKIDYGEDAFTFSLNEGDYQCPSFLTTEGPTTP